MKNRQQDFILGLVFLAFLAIFVGTIVFIAPRWGGDTQLLVVEFRHEQGMAPLKPGSAVVLGGAITIGKVSAVNVRSRDVDGSSELLIVVDAQIDRWVQLYEDCFITTEQPPVGGPGTLSIVDAGSAEKPRIDAGRPVAGRPPNSLASAIAMLSRRVMGPDGLLDKIERLVDANAEGSVVQRLLVSLADVNAVTGQLRVQLEPSQEASLLAKLKAVLDDVHAATTALRAQTDAQDAGSAMAQVNVALDRLGASLDEMLGLLRENRPVLQQTLANVEHATGTLDATVSSTLANELNRDDPRALLAKVHASLDKVNQSLDNVVTLSDTGKRLLVVNKPALDRTVSNLKDASQTMRVGMQELLLAPWRLFKQPKPGEVARLDTFEAARRFAEAATYLDDASARLEAASAAQAGGGEAELRELRESLRTAFERFHQAEAFLYEKMK